MAFRVTGDARPAGDRARGGLLFPLAVVALIACFELAVGRGDHFLAPMMIMAPALAAGMTTWPRTLAVSLIGAAAQAALLPYSGFDGADRRLAIELSASYVAGSAFSVYAAWWLNKREAGYRAVSSVADAAQKALLNTLPHQVGDIRLAARYASAADSARIGGDLYAVADTSFGVRVLVGDVQGKGLDAVQAIAVVLGAFREHAHDEPDLAVVARRIDRSVERYVGGGKFVTALFAEFPPEPHDMITLLHYGHVAPVKVSANGDVQVLDPPVPGVPLGLGQLGPAAPEPWREHFAPHDVLLLCTDGIIEARNRAGEFYPLTQRVGRYLAGKSNTLSRAADDVWHDVRSHAGGRFGDDCVLMLLARSESPTPQ